MHRMGSFRKAQGLRQGGATLSDVVVIACAAVSVMTLLSPALTGLRVESLRARCGANLQRYGKAYTLWAGDHTGLWPPRCRENVGCRKFNVAVDWMSTTIIKAELPYAESPNDGMSIVGEPTLQAGSAAPYGEPGATYNRANDFSLNRYLIPNWRLGTRMRFANCPADVDTLLAPDSDVQGFPQGSVASSFQLHGTSYATNVEEVMPWHGHGAWAASVESAINKRVGPNYNPELIYQPNRYLVAADLGIFYWNFQALLESSLGAPSGLGPWHESEPPPAVKPRPDEPAGWQNANALFGDLHVQYERYNVPCKGITLTPLGPYVNDEWSLYPYKRRAQDVANSP